MYWGSERGEKKMERGEMWLVTLCEADDFCQETVLESESLISASSL